LLNSRLNRFAPGVPAWQALNHSGWGDPNSFTNSIAEFQGKLYAATYGYTDDPGSTSVYRRDGDFSWTQVASGGFGDAHNVGADALVEFDGYLYAGAWNEDSGATYSTNGAQLWRSNNGTTWAQVPMTGLGPWVGEIFSLASFNGYLYAGTFSYDKEDEHGGEIWRCQTCDGSDWQTVKTLDALQKGVSVLSVVDGALYAGTYGWKAKDSTPVAAQLLRSTDGAAWTKAAPDGFGDSLNMIAWSFAKFKGGLYAGLHRADPTGQVNTTLYRCADPVCSEASAWEQVTLESGA